MFRQLLLNENVLVSVAKYSGDCTSNIDQQESEQGKNYFLL